MPNFFFRNVNHLFDNLIKQENINKIIMKMVMQSNKNLHCNRQKPMCYHRFPTLFLDYNQLLPSQPKLKPYFS